MQNKEVATLPGVTETSGRGKVLNSSTRADEIKVSSHRYIHALNDAYIDIEELEDIRYEMHESPTHCEDGDTYLSIVAETGDGKVYALNYPIRWSNKDWMEDCDTYYMGMLAKLIRDYLKPGEALRTYRLDDEPAIRSYWPWTWAAVIERV